MYTEFFGLSDAPFQLTPDPRFFFESSVHRRAMAHLIFGIEQSEGFIVITGEVGAGKTTILDRLLANLDPSAFISAKIVSTHLQGDDMIRAVAAALNVPLRDTDKATLLHRIENFLVTNYMRGLRTLLLVDEAQNIPPQALEELRMLSNFQVGTRVPLQSILMAQPQFRRTLANPDLEQFRQRIVASYHLGAMGATETREYIRHRLTTVGWANDPKITDEAFADIFENTRGVPRKINTLCTRLLLLCFLDELHCADRDAVRTVVEEMNRDANLITDFTGSQPSAGLMHPPPHGSGLEGGIDSGFGARLEKLEQTVAKHSKTVHFFSMFVEQNLFKGGSDDS